MKKPQKRIREPIYYYSDCMKYIAHKYKCNPDDYEGKFSGDPKDINKPFRSFWHWVLDRQSVCNGGVVYFSPEDLEMDFEEKELFAKTILKYILDEFLEPGEECVMMLCEW